MKHWLTKRTFLFCLLLALARVVLVAQNLKQDFKFDDDKTDYFRYSAIVVRGSSEDGDFEDLKSGGGTVDMQGAESGKLVITFYSNHLFFDGNNRTRRRNQKKYRLVVHPECTASPDHLKRLTNAPVEIKYDDKRIEKRVKYEILGNGFIDQLELKFDIEEEGISGACSQKINLPSYYITGMLSAADRECEPALSKFKISREKAVGELQALKRKYPNETSPCWKEVYSILDQYAEFQKALNSTCEDAKVIFKSYREKYGSGGRFFDEIKALSVCTTPPPPPPPPGSGKKEKAISDEEKAYNQIASGDREKLEDFIKKWEVKNPNSEFVRKAKEQLARYFPIEFTVDGTGKQRRITLVNAVRPKLKDMSLQSGLKIETADLSTKGTFEVTLERPGEYEVYVKDELNNEAKIRISSQGFSASLTPAPDNKSWLLRIYGGKKPYRVYLKSSTSAEKGNTIFRGKLETDTLRITQVELEERHLNRIYQVIVKSSDLKNNETAAGVIEAQSGDDDSYLLDIIMFLLLVFVTLCAGYGVYVLYLHRKEQTRKTTIYDRIQ